MLSMAIVSTDPGIVPVLGIAGGWVGAGAGAAVGAGAGAAVGAGAGGAGGAGSSSSVVHAANRTQKAAITIRLKMVVGTLFVGRINVTSSSLFCTLAVVVVYERTVGSLNRVSYRNRLLYPPRDMANDWGAQHRSQ
jgi:outer membrane lipoprotein SlyB